jgi:hypothetical protein
MSETVAIIIGFTPFHLIPMRELVSQAEGDIHIFHPMAGELGAFGAQPRVSFLGMCDSPGRSRWAKYFFARREIDKIMRGGKHVDLYLPHPFNPLANHAFFNAGSCSRFIYQDGILNYYDAITPLQSIASRFRQRAKGLAAGVWYRMYGGHLSGIDASPVSGGFFTHPDRIVSAGKFPSLRRLDFKHEIKEANAPVRQGTLFLDQPIESVVGRDRARELRRLTIDYTNALGGRVLYKPHYAQGHARSCDQAWVSLDPALSALPAERVFAKIDVANVVSFCTSALANIAMSDSKVVCHATAAKLVSVSVNGRPTDFGDIFAGFGVKVVDLLNR